MINWDALLERIMLTKELRENPAWRHKIQQLCEGAVVINKFLMERERRKRILGKLLEIARHRRLETKER